MLISKRFIKKLAQKKLMIQESGDLSRYRITENCDVITQEGVEKLTTINQSRNRFGSVHDSRSKDEFSRFKKDCASPNL